MSDDRPPYYHPPPPGMTETQLQAELTVGWLVDALASAQDFGAPAEVIAKIEAALAAAREWESQT